MLYEKIKAYTESGVYPMHMPGHKRNTDALAPGMPYDIDISEICGFDNLHNPRGILRETAEAAAHVYGSNKAFLLINGSTAGILAAIGAHAGQGDKILMTRNCHISVYNAVSLFGLKPVYIMPGTDEATGIAHSVDPDYIKSALELDKDIKLAVVTSPTYEGVVSDINSIAAIAHERNIPLLVDEAHGAHLGFSDRFPDSAIHEGADISVMSLHKTLPALTQCALLHVCGGRADITGISRMLDILQTTSPSYVLMASIDRCLRLLDSEKDWLFSEYWQNLDRFSKEIEALKRLSVLNKGSDASRSGYYRLDPGKIVIATDKTALIGTVLTEMLRMDYGIELEMASVNYAIAMTSVCDTADGFRRLSDALIAIDRSLPDAQDGVISGLQSLPLPAQAESPGGAIRRSGRFVPLIGSIGTVSLEYVWAYPPGVPVIAPGEIISEEAISYIYLMFRAGIDIKSTKGKLPQMIYVC